MSKKSKSTNDPSRFAKPYITSAANTLQSTYNSTQPGAQAIANQVAGYLPQLGAKVFGDNPTLKPAQTYAQEVLGGKFLNGNPQLDSMVGLARVNAMDGINSAFGQNGMDFSSGHAKSLAKGMNEAELGLRYQDYGAERDRMGQMTSLAPSLVAAEYAPLEAYLGAAQTATELPWLGAKYLSSGMGGLMGGYTTQTTKPSTFSMLAQMASNAAQAYAGGG